LKHAIQLARLSQSKSRGTFPLRLNANVRVEVLRVGLDLVGRKRMMLSVGLKVKSVV
jgi:hypothetical protein